MVCRRSNSHSVIFDIPTSYLIFEFDSNFQFTSGPYLKQIRNVLVTINTKLKATQLLCWTSICQSELATAKLAVTVSSFDNSIDLSVTVSVID
jgi:hypothetical protein